jgi:ABC-type transport system involved in cytochrome bd biosynthesis fused ATPase/permease subunit
MVGETGKKLSGGEKQKIAIAQALLRKAHILIFDETTTHLDKESARRIGELIESNFKEKTCLIISHQMKGFQGIDRVIRVERGRLEEEKRPDFYS